MIFGRDKIVQRILKRLETKSIIFVAERRVGKTEVLKKIQREAQKNQTIIYLDVENISSPIGFVEKLINEVSEHLKPTGKTQISKIWQTIKASIENIKTKWFEFKKSQGKDWKILLEMTLIEISENHNGLFVLLLDEIPYMLQKCAQNDTVKNNALEILDTLRSVRQTRDNIRMIYTGSIGLHHVVTSIRQGLSTEPLNDLDTIELKPLSVESAYNLAEYLIKDEDVELANSAMIKTIINQCDKVPFYIEKVIKRLSLLDEQITQENIDYEIEVIITDEKDDLEMSHFKTRIKDYYLGHKRLDDGTEIPHAHIVKSLLDGFSITDGKLSIDDCHRQISATFPFNDRELVIKLLDDMAKDYYIKSDTNKNYQFCFTLIKRWWKKANGLSQG